MAHLSPSSGETVGSMALSDVISIFQDPLIDWIHAPHGLGLSISGCILVDAPDLPDIAAELQTDGQLILLIGIQGDEALALLSATMFARNAVVLAKLPLTAAQSAADLDVAVISLKGTAKWGNVFELVQTVLRATGRDQVSAAASHVGMSSDNDLFGLAGTIAQLTSALITIDDPHNRVLAFSPLGEDADELRRKSILGRGAPPGQLVELNRQRVFERLRSGTAPIVLEADGETRRRMGVGIHDPRTKEYLGTIWAQESRVPFTATTETLLTSSASYAARLIGHTRRVNSLEAEATLDLLGYRGDDVTLSARRDQMLAGDAYPAMVVGFRSWEALSRQPTDFPEQWATLLAIQSAAYRTTSRTARSANHFYVLLPRISDGEAALKWVSLLLAGLSDDAIHDVGAVVSDPAANATEVAIRRLELDRVFDSDFPPASRTAVSVAASRSRILLDQVLDSLAMAGIAPDPRLNRLVDYDASHRVELVASLRAFIDTFGDVKNAAGILHIHVNTMRYRLRRIVEVSGLDLDDADTRLLMDLQMRMLSIQLRQIV